MKRFICLFLSLMMTVSLIALTGCSEKQEETNVLRICNCEDYIDETLLDDFTAQTGIEVVYSTYGTNENLYNELVINPNSYDLVVPSEYMIENLAVEGRLNKLDLSRVPNYQTHVSNYINERLKEKTFTVESGEYVGQENSISEYMVGYMWGTMGWVYNTDVVSEEDVNTWFSPFENPNLAKKITIKDAIRDSYIVGLAMVYEEELWTAKDNAEITSILNRTNIEDINRVNEKLNSIKSMLYGFEVDSGKNDIVIGNIDAYVAWSGDAAYAIDVAAGDAEDEDGTILEGDDVRNLSYYIPDEGSNIWFDGFCMPSGSQNYDGVYKFLNFISAPENVYRNMEYTGYTSMVAGDEIFNSIVIDWFDESEDLNEGEGIEVDLSYFFGDGDYKVTVSEESYGRLIAQYPEEKIVERCAIMSYFDSETLLDVNDMWESVKGETFDSWVIILTIALVVALLVLAVLYRNKDKLTFIKLPERKKTYAERKGYKIIKIEEIE